MNLVFSVKIYISSLIFFHNVKKILGYKKKLYLYLILWTRYFHRTLHTCCLFFHHRFATYIIRFHMNGKHYLFHRTLGNIQLSMAYIIFINMKKNLIFTKIRKKSFEFYPWRLSFRRKNFHHIFHKQRRFCIFGNSEFCRVRNLI